MKTFRNVWTAARWAAQECVECGGRVFSLEEMMAHVCPALQKTLILTVGLPRSGKTTWARTFARQCPIVNPDSIRLAIHGQRFVLSAEGFVWATARAMVKALFLAGHDIVVLDATNIKRKHRDQWASTDWQTAFHVLGTSKEECLRRADEIGDTEIQPIIERMAAEFEPLGPDESRFHAINLP